MTLQLGDNVRCVIPHLNLDFVGEVVDIHPKGAIMIKHLDDNCYVTTTESRLTLVEGSNDSIGRLATTESDPTGHA
jgi:hypothetical protein